jgi:hypothetical protein
VNAEFRKRSCCQTLVWDSLRLQQQRRGELCRLPSTSIWEEEDRSFCQTMKWIYARANFIPRVAAGLAPLLNLQLRALEATELERRLAKVEKLLARAEAKSSRKGYDEACA